MLDAEPKALYLAKCIDDLDKLITIPDLKKKEIKLICNSAQSVYREANEHRKCGDQEKSYLLYMKYLKVVKELKKHHKFNEEKQFISIYIGKNSVEEAYKWASELKNNLIARYKTLNDFNLPIVTEEVKPEVADIDMKIDVPESQDNAIENMLIKELSYITSVNLFKLLKNDTKKLMLLDARSSADFNRSHIKFPQCINIPEECIKGGITANKLEKDLPDQSKYLWSQRSIMDLIVLLDWNGDNVITGKSLQILKTILLKWDPAVIYKLQPVFLQGGYSDWLGNYPFLTTNPHVEAPRELSFDALIDDIEYPMFDNQPSSDGLTNITPNPLPLLNDISNTNFPSVDRTTKAAAVKTYEKILEHQKKLTTTSLDIERKRVSAEEHWEKLQQNIGKGTNNEADDLRQREIESEILQLENSQYDTKLLIRENQMLKEQYGKLLEGYQELKRQAENAKAQENKENTVVEKMDCNENAPKNPVKGQGLNDEESIKKIEIERAALERKRMAMESEREKKSADVRASKKLRGLEHEKENENVPQPNKPQIIQNNVAADRKPQFEIPQYDRTTKPMLSNITAEYSMPKREFYGMDGSEGRGLTGLRNLGNTCYMNSIIQCLNNTPQLMKYFCHGLYLNHMNKNRHDKSGKTQGAVAEELAIIMQTLWSDQYRFISPKDLKNVIGRFQSTFRGIEQQDSHEFLVILMDWLHDDLQILNNNSQINMEKLPLAEKAWLEYTKSKDSLILRLFYGQIKSTVKCIVCAKESITYDTFSNLSLELPADANRCSLKDCLELYLRDEKIMGWNCPICKDKRSAVKKLDISRLPPVLVIHFKRFYIDSKNYMSNTYKKKQTYIDFPIVNLNMGHFSLQSDNRKTLYNLYGVSNHYGSMESGHYTAYCKSSHTNRWNKFDDHLVTEISQRDVISSAAYILFYTSYSDSAL